MLLLKEQIEVLNKRQKLEEEGSNSSLCYSIYTRYFTLSTPKKLNVDVPGSHPNTNRKYLTENQKEIRYKKVVKDNRNLQAQNKRLKERIDK
jgi:hypothetical protein